MRRRNIKIAFFFILAVLLVYMFLPLSSDRFEIKIDNVRLSEKVDYLQEETRSSFGEQSPNILWIMVDDLSLADTDLYEDGPVKVPAMNHLAGQGVKFTNAYISSPVCSPSRASIATGRYNQRFGFEHQMHNRYLKNRLEYYAFRYLIKSYPWIPKYQTEVPSEKLISAMGLPQSEITLAEVLKKHDYKTGFIGKWHLGKNDNKSPNAFGFDHFYGFYSSHSLYSPEETPGISDQKIPEDFTDKYIWEGQRKGLQAIRLNNKEIKEGRYLTQAIAEESIDFIRKNKNQPFYLWTSFNAPHTPLQAPDKYVNMFQNEPNPIKRIHYAMIKCLDDEIGRLLDFLDDEGLSENTLVFLISDNGGAEYNLTTHNGPYQGGKITNFEGGVKVPMIMRWPGKIPRGHIFNNPVHGTDLFYTSVQAAGASLPKKRIFDGADLTNHINKNTVPHQYIYFEMGTNRGIRSTEWKLTWNEDNGDTLLFNLKKDPYEQQNLYSSGSQPVDELSSAFKEWQSNNIRPMWPSMIHYQYTADNGSKHYFDE